MQRKDLARRIADGVTAKLEFDFVCERANAFSEYYLHGVIIEIVAALTSPTDFRINTGYAHEALRREPNGGAGRQREVDFFIQPYDSQMTNWCIEAKWADSSHCSWDRILLDLCRLALVYESSPNTECLFVMSGPAAKVRSSLEALGENMPKRKGSGKLTGVLQVPGDSAHSIQRVYRLRDWAGRFVGNQMVLDGLPKRKSGKPNVPVVIIDELLRSSTASSGSWQTIVWRISSRRPPS